MLREFGYTGGSSGVKVGDHIVQRTGCSAGDLRAVLLGNRGFQWQELNAVALVAATEYLNGVNVWVRGGYFTPLRKDFLVHRPTGQD